MARVQKEQRPDEVEIEAGTAVEAIKIGLAKLGAKRSEVDIKVLREENKGLFRMHGAKLSKVRVTKKLQKKVIRL